MPTHCERQLPARECLLRRIYADTHGAPVGCAGCDLGGGMPETPRPAPRRAPAVRRATPRPEECALPPSMVEKIRVAMAAPIVPSPEAAAGAWLDQVADPAAPADGQAEFLHDIFAAEPQEPQEEHEDGQACPVLGLPGGVEDGDRAGELPGLRQDAAAGEQEQHAAPEALAESGGQAPGELEAPRGRAAAGGVDEAAPARENPALAVLAGVAAALCGQGLRRTSLRFLQSEFNAASPAGLAVRSPEAMAELAASAGLRLADHRGAPGVVLTAGEVRP